jgi:hypothetical protein
MPAQTSESCFLTRNLVMVGLQCTLPKNLTQKGEYHWSRAISLEEINDSLSKKYSLAKIDKVGEIDVKKIVGNILNKIEKQRSIS